MRRALENSSLEELPGGWRKFEYLNGEAEQLTQLLGRYELHVQHRNSQVWVASLLPYGSEHAAVPAMRKPGPARSLLLGLLPGRAKIRMLAGQVFRTGLEMQTEQLALQEGIEDGSIDGWYCARTGPHVQDCIEKLVANVEGGERYTHHNAYSSPGGGAVMGWAIAWEVDTLGQYLMKGRLRGSKNEGSVLLAATHPTLPEFSIVDPSFREAYHKLVENMKKNLTPEQLYEAAH